MNTYKMKLEDSVDSMIFDLLEVPIVDKDVEGAVDNTTVDGNVFTDYLWLKKNYVQKWSIMCDDEYSQLRGFYTRQFDNASVPTYKLYTGQNLSEDFIASGKYIMVNNTTDYNAPINSFQLLGDATQTTYSGKNLLPMINTTRTINGVTFTPRADGSIALSGTATAQTNYPINVDSASITRNVQLSAGTYTVSWGSNPASSGMFVQVYYAVDGGSGLYSTGTFTVSGTQAILGAYIRVNNGINTNGTVIYPMLEKSATATAYEPYVGGTASPNPDYPQAVNVVTGEQTVKIEGKNLFKTNRTQGVPSNTAQPNTTKRLFDFDEYVVGITMNNYYSPTLVTAQSVSDDVISVETSNVGYGLGFPIKTKSSTNYTVSFTTNGTNNDIIRASFYSADGSIISWDTGSNTQTEYRFTTPADCAFTVLVFRPRANTPTTYSNIMLVEGSTAESFEPYQGQTLPVNLGKNLFDVSSADMSNGYISSSDGSFVSGGGSCASKNAISLSSGTYVLSSSPTVTLQKVAFYTLSGTFVSLLTLSSNSFTVPLNGLIRVQLNGATPPDDIQIERGSQATSYAPYFTPYELAKIGTHQDRIYKTGGKWNIEKQVGKVVLDGSETWLGGGTSTGSPDCIYVHTEALDSLVGGFSDKALSNNFTSASSTIFSSSTFNVSCFSVGSSSTSKLRFLVKNDVATTLSTWKTWLGTHPTTVYYPLATPTTTEITSQALIDQLNAIQNASLYTGINNISNSSVNLAGDIDLGYTLIYEKENIIIPQTSVRLTLTDGGVINVCGCRQNVQLGMRETIQ